jgi:hypothetical protein
LYARYVEHLVCNKTPCRKHNGSTVALLYAQSTLAQSRHKSIVLLFDISHLHRPHSRLILLSLKTDDLLTTQDMVRNVVSAQQKRINKQLSIKMKKKRGGGRVKKVVISAANLAAAINWYARRQGLRSTTEAQRPLMRHRPIFMKNW